MEWTSEMIVRLRWLWDAGHSTAEIGRRMGVSKNAIIGKVRRLHLQPRPSPIRPAGSGKPRQYWKRDRPDPVKVTLPSMACISPPEVKLPEGWLREDVKRAQARVREWTSPAPHSWRPSTRRLPYLPCCWPIGEPRTPSFHFCDAAALPGKPYCDEHAKIGYVRVRQHHEDVA